LDDQGHIDQKRSNSGGKEIAVRVVAPSQRDDQVICSVGTARRKIMKLKTVGNWRTMKREMTCPNQKVNLTIVLFVASDNSSDNDDVLLAFVRVLLMILNGYSTLLVDIMSTLTELCFVHMNM
jgi:hypothetical protein